MRPDLKKMNRQLAGLKQLDENMQRMPGQTAQLEEEAASLLLARQKEQAGVRLKDISVEELKSARAGIRTGVLTDAGYYTLYDLHTAGDPQILALDGIGEKQLSSIRAIIDEFLTQLAGKEAIRLPQESGSEKEDALVCSLARCRLASLVLRDSADLRRDLHIFVEEADRRARVRGRFHWFFARAESKEETLQVCGALDAYLGSRDFARAQRLYGLYLDAVGISTEKAYDDLKRNAAAYYALIEKLAVFEPPADAIYGHLSAQLAREVNALKLSLEGFNGDLRGYQTFGVKYILHQKKVLLGDEMGLGKTIQAIAAMVHLDNLYHLRDAGSPDVPDTPGVPGDAGARSVPDAPGVPGLPAIQTSPAHFLIVCPASVLANWCREIRKFSGISAYLLHGKLLERELSRWQQEGGAAVTNYESLRHITDREPGAASLAMLVVDEAHYIKNPEAQRTKHIRRLEEKADHVLLMTGTPLENRVHELCTLIGCIRPDLENRAREYVGLRRSDAFMDILAPVYLRRHASQVLEELPELITSEEWCLMTDGDRKAYITAVAKGSFMTMRRVSFLQEDMLSSSKAERLRELCLQAAEDGKKIIVYSYFRETLRKLRAFLGDICTGEITGSTDPLERQDVIDRFTGGNGNVLLSQVQAGGTGLNIQAASVVIFCEPQIKPSLEYQAVSRAYRMGQLGNVLVYHLLCEGTTDEAVREILRAKEQEFLLYADESVMAEAESQLADREWVRSVVARERSRYLPAVVSPEAPPLQP